MLPASREQGCKQLSSLFDGLRSEGFAIVEEVLSDSFIQITREAMYRAREAMVGDVGEERLLRAGESGVLRLMMKYDSHFLKFLEIPELLTIIDSTVSDTAIMHLQNGFILPSSPKGETPAIFQNSFHRDFPRLLNGYVVSVNIMFAIDEFTAATGATRVVPGTHQKMSVPDQDYLRENASAIECAVGS